MEAIGVLMTSQNSSYLEQKLELHKDYKLFRLWNQEGQTQLQEQEGNGIHVVVGCSYKGVDAGLIDALPELQIIVTLSTGFDNIDLAKCDEKGIRVVNTPEVGTATDAADLALTLILSLSRRVPQCDSFVRRWLWDPQTFDPITKFSGKTVGIIGMGRIGAAIAKRVESFECPIGYYSGAINPELSYTYYPTVVELALNCDILVVACALTEETCHIVNQEVLGVLDPRGYLINIGPSGLVDQPELVAALSEGRIGGAGLAVFQGEPHVPKKLFELDNVVLLPNKDVADIVLANLEAHFSGKPLLTPVE